MKETVKLLWVHEEMSSSFGGILIGYEKCNGSKDCGAFSLSLLNLYKQIYYIKNLRVLKHKSQKI